MDTSADKLTKEERIKILGIDKLVGDDKAFDTFDNLADAQDTDVKLTVATSKLLSQIMIALGEKTEAPPPHVMQMMCGAMALSMSRLMTVMENVYNMDSATTEKLCEELAHVLKVNLIANVRARVFDE